MDRLVTYYLLLAPASVYVCTYNYNFTHANTLKLTLSNKLVTMDFTCRIYLIFRNFCSPYGMELQPVEFRPQRRSDRESPDQVQQETGDQGAIKDNVNQQPLNESQREQVIPCMQDDQKALANDEQSADSSHDSTKTAPVDQEVCPENRTDGFDPSPFRVPARSAMIISRLRRQQSAAFTFHDNSANDEVFTVESSYVDFLDSSLQFAVPDPEPPSVQRKWPAPPSSNKESEQCHEVPASRSDSSPLNCFGRCWSLNRQESSGETRGGTVSTLSERNRNGSFDNEPDVDFSPGNRLLPREDASGPSGSMKVSDVEEPQGDVSKSELEKEDDELKDVKEAAENDIDSALNSGDIKKINECVTPSILVKCTTSSLKKAMEVSHKLHALARQRGPDEEDFLKLEKNVEEFEISLLDPLKSDDRRRDVFGADIDSFVDMAIEKGQKRFIAHPVVYNLLHEKWYGEFAAFKNSPWTKSRWWTWLFLNLWTPLDVILFPALFLVFFICHVITKVIRKKRGVKVGFVICATGPDAKTNTHPFMTETVKGIIETLGYTDGKFAVIARDNEKVKWMGFQKGYSKDDFLANVISAPTQPPGMHLTLRESLDKAKELFNEEDKENEKVLVMLADYKATLKDDTKLDDADQTTRRSGADRVVAVAIGPFAKPQQFKVLTDEDDIIISHGLESPKELGKKIFEKIQGKDVFEWYKLYFLTPYFIYLRDTVSFLALLILHYAVCLAPSTISLSGVEITIIIFFIGRVMMEIKQFVDARETTTDSGKSNGHALWRKVALYFRDRWNALDFIIILTFFVIVPLRLVTLSLSSITQNRTLAVANYMYGLNTMLLTLRVLGSILESTRRVGVMQIALFKIIGDVTVIFWQFVVAILAFSMAITKVFMAEKSFVVSSEKENEQLCNDAGVFCWWGTLRHLMWSLLGIADADKFGSTDKTSINLVWALYAMFLVIAVILLVNMLIAVLSNVYQGVEDNSLPEWCFKRAIMHRTYSNYHPIPVPLNVITIPCCCCFNKEENDDKRIKERREKALDKLMRTLEGRYFATHGYSFPLTGEQKMDQVFEELAGNRKITNQIAQRVFFSENVVLSYRWVGNGIRTDGNTLTYSAPDDCPICQHEEPTQQHCVSYSQPLDRKCPMFEVLIQESGERRLLSVGVAQRSERFRHGHGIIPGWIEDSVGYHIDDGRIFHENHRTHGQELKDAMAHRGDVITCRVHFNQRKNSSEVPVSFSLNGKEVGRKRVNSAGELYPCIGMGYEGISVQFTMGRFDNHAMMPIPVDKDFDMTRELIRDVSVAFFDSHDTTHNALNELQSQVNDMNGVLRQIMAALAVNQPEGGPKRIANDN